MTINNKNDKLCFTTTRDSRTQNFEWVWIVWKPKTSSTYWTTGRSFEIAAMRYYEKYGDK